MVSARTWANELRWFVAFFAGFCGTVFFHQPALWLCKLAGLTTRAPFSMQPVPPFGVPATLSLAFWGGVWGMLLIPAIARIRSDAAYWGAAALFGALLPTLVAWLVVAPLKGQQISLGFPALLVGPVINAAWGLGTAVSFRLIAGSR